MYAFITEIIAKNIRIKINQWLWERTHDIGIPISYYTKNYPLSCDISTSKIYKSILYAFIIHLFQNALPFKANNLASCLLPTYWCIYKIFRFCLLFSTSVCSSTLTNTCEIEATWRPLVYFLAMNFRHDDLGNWILGNVHINIFISATVSYITLASFVYLVM